MHRLLLAAILIGPSIAQPGTQPTAVFAGTVRDAVTGRSLPHTQVRLLPPGEGKRYQATTDSSGAFRFNALTPGAYRFETVRGGYEDSHTAVLKDGASPASVLQFAPGDSVSDARITLQPHGVISGRARDSNGDPLGGALVLAMGERWQRGHRSYQPFANGVADESGQYRLQVAAGHYYMMATGARQNSQVPDVFAAEPGDQEMRLGQAVYPAATVLEAGTPLEIGPGQQLTGIDFKLAIVPCYHVRGTVKTMGQSGALVLTPPDGGWWSLSPSSAFRGDGQFDIAGVLPGRYVLDLYPNGGTISHVEVKDRDVNGIEAAPLPHVEVSGRIRIEEPTRQSLARIEFRGLDPGQYSGDAASPKADGTFTVSHLIPGRYAIVAAPASGPYVSSVLLDGRQIPGGVLDLSHGAVGPVEIVLDSVRGRIAGKLRFDGESVPEAVALLVSADGLTGNTGAREAPIDQGGRFQFAAVPVGRWYVFAVPRFDEGLWQNMDVVLALASEATIAEVSKNGSTQVEVSLMSADDIARATAGVPR